MRLGIADARPETSVAGAWRPRRLVAATPDGVLDVAAACEIAMMAGGADARRAAELAAVLFPPSLTQLLAGGARVLNALGEIVSAAPDGALLAEHEFVLRCPVDPPAFRDFMTFDEHVRNTYAPTGKTPPDVLYERPAYYKGSTGSLIGPEQDVPWPHYAEDLDYELEFGVVIARAGADLSPDDALTHIFGVTLVNDFSARGIQFWEMRSRLGPAKGKDFATAVGPWVITLDELDIFDLDLRVAVNGETRAVGSSASALWRIDEAVAWASAAEALRPGELIASGTIGGGSGLELGRSLSAGDVVEMRLNNEAPLRNRIGTRPEPAWMPRSRRDSAVTPAKTIAAQVQKGDMSNAG